MAQATGYSLEIISQTQVAITILGYGNNNKLLEVGLLSFTGNGTASNQTIGSTVKRLVFHANALANGGSVTVRFTWGSNTYDLTVNPDGIAVFNIT